MKPLTVQALERIGKDWSKSSEDREAKLQHVKEFASFAAKTYGLQDIGNLKPRHVEGYINNLREQGLSNGTICNRLVHVRLLCDKIGKPGIVGRENEMYGVNRGESRSNPITQNTEKVEQIRAQIREIAATGNQKYIMANAAAELRDAFGMRAKESLCSTKIVEIQGFANLRVNISEAVRVEGAKGGRIRDIAITTKAQVEALRTAQEASRLVGSVTGRIIPPHMSLKQAYNAQRYIWEKLGGTRAEAAHMHSDRHEHAQELVRQGYTAAQIQQILGHGDDRPISCYVKK
jgi:integrase